jgi:sugar (pentulose or hexulose) kinase
MVDEIWIGLDLGTQSARALAASGTGDVLAAASRRLGGRRDGPTHEQDPAGWWEALSGACSEALARVDGRAVCGVACCSTSGTVLLVGADGRPAMPALMYDDARAADEARRVADAGAATWRTLGYRMQPTWGLPKLLWLLDQGEAPAGARLAHQADVVNRRLAGTEVASDWSHALKSGYDLLAGAWPFAVLDELGIPASLMPAVAPPGSRIGEVCESAAAATGIPAGTPLLAGMTDGCAAQIAAGALGAGAWNSVLGTTLVLKGVTEELLCDPGGVVYSHR